MSTDYGLKLAQQMYPLVRPLPWPPDQPIAEIHKNADGKYFVHIFYVTCTNVIKGGLRMIWPEKNRYGCNAEDMRVALFDTLEEATLAYTSFCAGNERKTGIARDANIITNTICINGNHAFETEIVKEYF